ncbi:hypothetical protein ACP70R_047730 [Stipagrostis hirtigluma subsp. patula]
MIRSYFLCMAGDHDAVGGTDGAGGSRLLCSSAGMGKLGAYIGDSLSSLHWQRRDSQRGGMQLAAGRGGCLRSPGKSGSREHDPDDLQGRVAIQLQRRWILPADEGPRPWGAEQMRIHGGGHGFSGNGASSRRIVTVFLNTRAGMAAGALTAASTAPALRGDRGGLVKPGMPSPGIMGKRLRPMGIVERRARRRRHVRQQRGQHLSTSAAVSWKCAQAQLAHAVGTDQCRSFPSSSDNIHTQHPDMLWFVEVRERRDPGEPAACFVESSASIRAHSCVLRSDGRLLQAGRDIFVAGNHACSALRL